MPHANEKIWGPIDMATWTQTPCLTGRVATESDVLAGRAVFCFGGNSKPFDMPLPTCAIHRDAHTQKMTPVILIQAIELPKGKIIGMRYLTGGNAICTLAELEILKQPDERFK